MKALETRVPPVAQFFVAMAIMWLLAKYVPALSVQVPGRKLLVALFFCVGGIIAVPAIAAFRSAGTTVDPRRPEVLLRLAETQFEMQIAKNAKVKGFREVVVTDSV